MNKNGKKKKFPERCAMFWHLWKKNSPFFFCKFHFLRNFWFCAKRTGKIDQIKSPRIAEKIVSQKMNKVPKSMKKQFSDFYFLQKWSNMYSKYFEKWSKRCAMFWNLEENNFQIFFDFYSLINIIWFIINWLIIDFVPKIHRKLTIIAS